MRYIWIGFFIIILVACQPEPELDTDTVYVYVDNFEYIYRLAEPMTVEEFLAAVASIDWDDNDRIVPSLYTQVVDGTRITIVRVDEEETCETEELPYQEELRPVEGLAPEEQRIQRQGQTGEQRICYRVIYENGIQQQRIPIGEPEIIREPVNRIIAVGVDDQVEPIAITGTLAYINNGNVWVISRTSTNKRPLTLSNDIDSLVLDLSPDGRYAMYTRRAEDSETFVNELWVMDTTQDDVNSAVQLIAITDVLHAEWLISDDYSISYSTSEVRDISPGWDPFNNLLVSRIDPQTGDAFNPRVIVPENSGGAYGWWGTVYHWSPDGQTLAWAQADSIGIYDNDTNAVALTQFDVFRSVQDISWRTSLSWSPDSQLIASVIHGPPQPGVPPDSSRIFSVVVTDVSGNFEAMIDEGAGIWASPKFSPLLDTADSPFPQGYLAYLRVRDPNQIYGQYDLIVADRDGSNARLIFPQAGQAGIQTSDFGLYPQDYTWSPDGRQIALIYQGNLYIIDVITGASYQMTFDGGSQHPVWSR